MYTGGESHRRRSAAARRSRSRDAKSAKKGKEKKSSKTVILYYPDLFYTWTNKHYRRVSSGGNECARSSRRGAGLTSSSLGGTLDPDGPQGHAVVTQKRKLRTPVWARLRNIHISVTTFVSHTFSPSFSSPLPFPSPLRLNFRPCSRFSFTFTDPPAIRSASVPSTLFVVFSFAER